MNEGFFPVKERLIKGAKLESDAVFIADIGGSIGHDLAEFAKKHPDAPGRLVLQDLPAVLGQISSLDARIERMAYDFHTEQPLKGGILGLSLHLQVQYADRMSRCPCLLHALCPP